METESLIALFPALLESVPWEVVPASFAVDLLQFCSTSKPIIRSAIRSPSGNRNPVQNWAKSFGLKVCFDSDEYFFVGRRLEEAMQGRSLDRSCEPHAFEFGQALGYPQCCCRYVADATEEMIDSLAKSQEQWTFSGSFSLIDPSGYASGCSLISHLPCSTSCELSLVLATAAVECLLTHSGVKAIQDRWWKWL